MGRRDLNLVPSHFRDLAPEHFPILHLKPSAPPSPAPCPMLLVGGTWVKVQKALRCTGLVCTVRTGCSPAADHRYLRPVSPNCPCPVVGTRTSFVCAAQAHRREADTCSSSSYDCFIPNQKGTDLRKEVWCFSRTHINLCIFFTYFIGLVSTFLLPPTAIWTVWPNGLSNP